MNPSQPIIRKFDATRDIKGSFYAPYGTSIKIRQLKNALEAKMSTKFTCNTNTFNSCFQFMEGTRSDKLYMRVKIYNKGLQLI